MTVMKIRNAANTGWIEVGGGVRVFQQAAAPGTTYPGQLWLDTDATGGGPTISDADEDTKIQCEESADEDIVRIDAAGTEVWSANKGGVSEIIRPLQPAFRASIAAGTQANIATGSAVTIMFAQEVYDVGSNFDTTTYTFTAPVDGKYLLGVQLHLTTMDTAATYALIRIVATQEQIGWIEQYNHSADLAYCTASFSSVLDMDANDTAYVDYYQSGGAQQVDVFGGATSVYNSKFYGYLLG